MRIQVILFPKKRRIGSLDEPICSFYQVKAIQPKVFVSWPSWKLTDKLSYLENYPISKGLLHLVLASDLQPFLKMLNYVFNKCL